MSLEDDNGRHNGNDGYERSQVTITYMYKYTL